MVGDKRRFDLFAKFIAKHQANTSLSIADIAGGKGYLQMALQQQGYANVTSWDVRRRNAKGRPHTQYGYFIWDRVRINYDLVVGMHPDGATDHIIMYAIKHMIPFIVCPCCVMPSAVTYWQPNNYGAWIEHLTALSEKNDFAVTLDSLKISGRNLVIIGKPLTTRSMK